MAVIRKGTIMNDAELAQAEAERRNGWSYGETAMDYLLEATRQAAASWKEAAGAGSADGEHAAASDLADFAGELADKVEAEQVTRRAAVMLTGKTTPAIIARYLYANYRIAGVVSARYFGALEGDLVLIEGHDRAGFTLDAILDRLASGLHFGRELAGYPE
jgi:hypothetical protein